MSTFRIYHPYPNVIPYELTPIMSTEDYKQFKSLYNVYNRKQVKRNFIAAAVFFVIMLACIGLIVKGCIPIDGQENEYAKIYIMGSIGILVVDSSLFLAALLVIGRKVRNALTCRLNGHFAQRGLTFNIVARLGHKDHHTSQQFVEITTSTAIVAPPPFVIPMPLQQQQQPPVQYFQGQPQQQYMQYQQPMYNPNYQQQQQQQQPPVQYYNNNNVPVQQTAGKISTKGMPEESDKTPLVNTKK
ncbi:hypothetical protein DFA_11004 [Cavenderia fasciculata]|uniref:Transmembrane protein n=1 Tax=Cavenderia fasciculata TaxID=261658 RepID=F4QC06_CACFS|nr:uncharacterized protein DFA_11004 [Cavenderia fasciculata]EGG14744.1 hypothetical protein DFA_11004 [Cavenderia fasciculata]|eukprot:XP_004351252.1 hypothetical protein DFA_11004 [Cavenderia fasciculata]